MESRDRHRWLSADDILIYVRDRMLRDFPGSVIESSPPGSDTYRIQQVSSKGMSEFQAFLAPRGFKGRTRLLGGSERQRFRFTSSDQSRRVAKWNASRSYTHWFVSPPNGTLEDDGLRHAPAVAAVVNQKVLPAACGPGVYVLAARRWSSGSMAAGTMTSVRIGYAGTNAATGEPIGADTAERMMAAAAEHGRPIPNAANHDGLAEASKTLTQV